MFFISKPERINQDGSSIKSQAAIRSASPKMRKCWGYTIQTAINYPGERTLGIVLAFLEGQQVNSTFNQLEQSIELPGLADHLVNCHESNPCIILSFYPFLCKNGYCQYLESEKVKNIIVAKEYQSMVYYPHLTRASNPGQDAQALGTHKYEL